MTSFAHAESTFLNGFKHNMLNLILYSPQPNVRINIANSSGEINILILMTPFTHTGSTFEKLLKRDICRIQSSTHWRKLSINIAYSSGEIKL